MQQQLSLTIRAPDLFRYAPPHRDPHYLLTRSLDHSLFNNLSISHFMKKILFLAILTVTVYTSFSQETKLLSFVFRPKANASELFDQKMAAFAKAHFKGNMDFRVQQVFGGKNDGNFVMSASKLTTLGYYDGTDYDKESKPFWTAFNKEIRPLIEDFHMEFLNFHSEYSSVAQKAYTAKNVATERVIKVGKVNDYLALQTEAKAVWEKAGVNIALYRNVTGNTNRFVSIRRLSKGWSELDPGGTPLFKDVFIQMYSEARYNDFIKAINECTESVNVQYQYFRADLSNK